MSKDVKISVIMSVYNGEEYLAEAIDSVFGQTFEDFDKGCFPQCAYC